MRRHLRRLGITRLGWAIIALWLLVGVAVPFVAGVLVARADEGEREGSTEPSRLAVEPPRFAPSSRGDRPALEDLVAAHFPPEEVAHALAVIACESRGDARATGRLGEQGLLQLHPIWQSLAERLFWPGVSLYDAEVNVATAAALWRQAGWAPWSCAR